MSLSDLAALGSFISGLAVLLSFAFLALQLRQSNVNQRASMQGQRSARIADMVYRRLDPRLTDLTLRGNRGDTSMSPEEVWTYHRMNYATFLNFEDTYLQDRLGTIDSDAWKSSSIRLKHLLAAPGLRVSWKRWRSNFPGGFAESVDQIVAEARMSGWDEDSVGWATEVEDELRLSAK